MNCGKKNPDTLILVIYLLPAMLFFSFFKKIPDMLILAIYLPPAMLVLISQRTMPLWVVSKNLDMLILVLTTWHTERLHAFLIEPKHFLLTWEVKYAIGLIR